MRDLGQFARSLCRDCVHFFSSVTAAELLAICAVLLHLFVLTPMRIPSATHSPASFVAYSMYAIHVFVSAVAIFGTGMKRPGLLIPYLGFDAIYVFYMVCYFIPALHPIPPNTVFVNRWNFYHGSDHLNELVVESVKRLHEQIQTNVAIATFVYLLFALIIWWALLIAYCVIKAEATITSGNTTASTTEGNARATTNNDDGAGTATTCACSGSSNDEESPQAVVVGSAAVVGGLMTGLRIVDDNDDTHVLAQAAGTFADKDGACPV